MDQTMTTKTHGRMSGANVDNASETIMRPPTRYDQARAALLAKKGSWMARSLQLTAFVLALGSATAAAQDLSWHGFVQSDYSVRTTGMHPSIGSGDFTWADHRLQLKLSVSEGSARAQVKVDFYHDAIARLNGIDIREMFADYSIGKFDFRLGRQVITWGLGDLVFINDLFPKDWKALFSGQPMEYLKVGVNGAKLTFSDSPVSAELAIVPFFQPDNLVTADRFFFLDPFKGVSNRTEDSPDANLENMELAFRTFGTLADYEISLYAYRGFGHMPSAYRDSLLAGVVYFYPELSAYGLSLQKAGYGSVLSLEYGYYDSRQDRSGTNPMIPNSFHKFLIGLQRQGRRDFTYSFQFYDEYMAQFDEYETSAPQGFAKQERFRTMLTARVTQLLKYQTWKLSLFTFYSPTDADYYLIPETQYKFSDRLWLTIGGNVFGGEKESTFFGQFNRNDNLYSILRYGF